MPQLNWKSRSTSIAIFLLLLLIINPEARAFLLLSQLIGYEVIFILIATQIRLYWPTIAYYTAPIQQPILYLFNRTRRYLERIVPKKTSPLNMSQTMLHHLSFGVTDIHRSAIFYDAVLAPLGYIRVWEDFEGDDAAVGYGIKGGGDKFAIKLCPQIAISQGFHLAFSAIDRAAVNAFYTAAIANGGSDNGPAGLRPHYGEHYYAAFVIDPDGYHIEAVINTPPQ